MGHIKIKDWALEDRPREKLTRQGVEALSDAELLAILLRSGDHDKTAVALAREVLLSCDNSLIRLGRLNLHDLIAFDGMGTTKAASILAALELGRRRAQLSETAEQEPMRDSGAIFRYFHHRLADLPHEELWALYLSQGAKILHAQRISTGGTNFSCADVKMIVLPALQHLANNVVLCHNHPHGQPRPSQMDRDVTEKVQQALKLFDIKLLDHLIIADHQYFSFVDEGLL
jgi:DNA repair protein RadC